MTLRMIRFMRPRFLSPFLARTGEPIAAFQPVRVERGRTGRQVLTAAGVLLRHHGGLNGALRHHRGLNRGLMHHWSLLHWALLGRRRGSGTLARRPSGSQRSDALRRQLLPTRLHTLPDAAAAGLHSGAEALHVGTACRSHRGVAARLCHGRRAKRDQHSNQRK